MFQESTWLPSTYSDTVNAPALELPLLMTHQSTYNCSADVSPVLLFVPLGEVATTTGVDHPGGVNGVRLGVAPAFPEASHPRKKRPQGVAACAGFFRASSKNVARRICHIEARVNSILACRAERLTIHFRGQKNHNLWRSTPSLRPSNG